MGSKLFKISQLSLHIKLHINIFYENEVYIIWFWSLSPSDDVGIKAITRSVLGKNGEQNEEVTDERLKGIEPKMIELIMNEVILVFEKNECSDIFICSHPPLDCLQILIGFSPHLASSLWCHKSTS